MKKLLYAFVLLITVLIILVSLKLVAFNTVFYKNEFSRLGIYERFGNETVDENAQTVLDYLKNNGELVTGFFNEKEIAHLSDVRLLVSKAQIALYLLAFTVILFIVYMFMKKEHGLLGRIIVYSGLLSLLVILLFLLVVSLNFEGVFTTFHLLNFDNDLWLLNPETDNLIALFPERFFYDASIMVIYIAVFISLASIAFGLILLRHSRKH